MKLPSVFALVAIAVAQFVANDTGPAIKVNQIGYLVDGPKKATLVTKSTAAVNWALVGRAGAIRARGRSVPRGLDTASGLNVHTIDFSSFRSTGQELTLEAGRESSYPFSVSRSLYGDVFRDALHWFYYQRSGIAIDGFLAGPEYARPAGHVQILPNLGDKIVPCQPNNASELSYGSRWTSDYTLDVSRGWYDAGDHGKYVVNGGISTAQLLQTYERSLHAGDNRASLRDGTIPIPERRNAVPDILDEARWELEFLLKMQVPKGSRQLINGTLVDVSGMAHHKIHDNEWTGIPLDPADDPKKRELHRPSTAASLNLAATAAMAARLYRPFDDRFAKKCLTAAQTAYAAARRNPSVIAPDSDGSYGGGAYGDPDVSDEFYWAAAELYLTTSDKKYADDLTANAYSSADAAKAFSVPTGFSWGTVAALARLDLATVPSKVPGRRAIVQSIYDAADAYVAILNDRSNGFSSLLDQYVWGSNSNHLNSIQILATAYDLSGKKAYRNAALEAADYIFGRNGLGLSYVVGYGQRFPHNVHSRLFAPQADPSSPRAPAGSLSGGANEGAADPPSDQYLTGCPPQLCWIDDVESYSTNEIAINWNSALVWTAAWLAEQ